MQSMGHDLRRGLNNINPLGGNNYKNINKWLAEMKNIDSTLKTLDKEISADAKLIATWGSTEGDDLADVCQRMSQLMEEVGLIQQAFSLRHTAYRKAIKSIKTQEMTLEENRKKKHDLTAQITKHQKSSKENPIKLMELQSALERVSAELLNQELELMQFKRITIKDAFDSKFDAMLEYAEKMALIAGYGRAITFVIDTDSQAADRMRIYNGSEYTAAAVSQVKAAVTSWQPQPVSTPPVRTQIAEPSQDELALSAAVAACNTTTPPLSHTYAANDGYSSDPSGGQNHTAEDLQASPPSSDHGSYPVPPKSTYTQQANQVQEQQRLLELEQQRLYQQNLASYSPERSPTQNHYQVAAASGGVSNNSGIVSGSHTPNQHRRSETQDLYPPPTLPVYENGSSNTSTAYGTYNQYQGAPARNYRLGFVDPRERSQRESEYYHGNNHPSLPPLHFSQSPILHEK
ncbi:Eisosome component PIL1-domain-containing protein [Lobosporangium transversale]|uniref:Eisosome component PIL1-domain-containing protein n=1 Tax=Lobosporangium transversale TaxID=64571 RepID=A0A1Y2GL73_9FUNG|nr:Eisosome component PIL1-domain-containing protein [Lobosporangium transversale]ORZ14362.1 Eisosome component PIL1-domain-containing protein [Lobosporangium transversale]|eukprot:XP_021880840.1 Eisosome component PIL1-domain-containing protein [Lobosporangium transversale]